MRGQRQTIEPIIHIKLRINRRSPDLGPEGSPSAYHFVFAPLDNPSSQAISGPILAVEAKIIAWGYHCWLLNSLHLLRSIRMSIKAENLQRINEDFVDEKEFEALIEKYTSAMDRRNGTASSAEVAEAEKVSDILLEFGLSST
jgi:hypothetical protein